ncbi:MAG: hypothetical protein QM715_16760 [Nibricoccus sp.]
MKLALLLPIAILSSVTVFADDVTLADGRVFKDAIIVSETPRTVTLRHATGLCSVAKPLLPAELQAKHPVDEAAAKVAEEKNRQDRVRARELEQAEYQRSLKLRAQREETAKLNERAPIEEESNRRDRLNSARAEMQVRTEMYFKTEYPLVASAKNTGAIKVAFASLELIEGWANRWRGAGRCEIEYDGEIVKVYPTYPANTVDAYAKAGQLQELSYTPYETTRYKQKIQDFEVIYNAESADPSFELTLR